MTIKTPPGTQPKPPKLVTPEFGFRVSYDEVNDNTTRVVRFSLERLRKHSVSYYYGSKIEFERLEGKHFKWHMNLESALTHVDAKLVSEIESLKQRILYLEEQRITFKERHIQECIRTEPVKLEIDDELL